MLASFQYAWRRFLPVIGVAILSALLAGLAAVALVFPGFMLLTMWYVATPACVVERIGPWKAMMRSQFLDQGSSLESVRLYHRAQHHWPCRQRHGGSGSGRRRHHHRHGRQADLERVLWCLLGHRGRRDVTTCASPRKASIPIKLLPCSSNPSPSVSQAAAIQNATRRAAAGRLIAAGQVGRAGGVNVGTDFAVKLPALKEGPLGGVEVAQECHQLILRHL